MKEILDKISSYNLFNYLLPGIIFALAVEKLTGYPLLGGDIIVNAFVAYFTGLVVSRFGSLVVEPILRKVRLVKFVNYSEYVKASKKDPKIELFSEINNSYRTLSSMLILTLLLTGWEFVEYKWIVLKGISPYLLLGSLIVMFLYSYKKQTEYIIKRVALNHK